MHLMHAAQLYAFDLLQVSTFVLRRATMSEESSKIVTRFHPRREHSPVRGQHGGGTDYELRQLGGLQRETVAAGGDLPRGDRED